MRDYMGLTKRAKIKLKQKLKRRRKRKRLANHNQDPNDYFYGRYYIGPNKEE